MINIFINIYNTCNYFEFNVRHAYYKVHAYFSFFHSQKNFIIIKYYKKFNKVTTDLYNYS